MTPTLYRADLQQREVKLGVVAFLAASSSILALILHALGWLRMPYAVSFLTVPGLVLLLAVMVWAGRGDCQTLRRRLIAGTVAGALALVAYDLGRLVLVSVPPLRFNPFTAITGFGVFITGGAVDDPLTLAAGWAYHISNGWTFGVTYALLFGRSSWWWGLVWAMVLEIGMLVVYPLLFKQLPTEPFLIVSFAGHAMFGAALGAYCRRYA